MNADKKKNKEMYAQIFDLYEIEPNHKDKARHYLRKKLDQEYPEQDWDDLSEEEKKIFSYVLIRNDMIDRYVEPSKHKRIKKTLDQETRNLMLVEKKYKSELDFIGKRYDLSGLTEDEKKKQYLQFKNHLVMFNDQIQVPTYEKWAARPLRIYDYLMAYEFDTPPEPSNPYAPSESEVLDVIIRIIIKIIEDQFYLEINVSKIREALEFIHKYPLYDLEDDIISFERENKPSKPSTTKKQNGPDAASSVKSTDKPNASSSTRKKDAEEKLLEEIAKLCHIRTQTQKYMEDLRTLDAFIDEKPIEDLA